MNRFVVTHFARQPAEPDRWVILPFVSRHLGSPAGPFFFGFETLQQFSATAILERVEIGALKELPRPYPLQTEQALWLTPEHKIYIASRRDPRGDSTRFLVATDDELATRSDRIGIMETSDEVIRNIHSRKPPGLLAVNQHYVSHSGLYDDFVAAIMDKIKEDTRGV